MIKKILKLCLLLTILVAFTSCTWWFKPCEQRPFPFNKCVEELYDDYNHDPHKMKEIPKPEPKPEPKPKPKPKEPKKPDKPPQECEDCPIPSPC